MSAKNPQSQAENSLLMEAALQAADAFKNLLVLSAAALIRSGAVGPEALAEYTQANPQAAPALPQAAQAGVEAAPAAAQAGVAARRGPGRPRKGAGAAAAPAPAAGLLPGAAAAGPVAVVAQAGGGLAGGGGGALNYDEHLKPYLVRLSEVKGMGFIESMLKGMGAATARDIPVANYPEVIALIQSHLQPAPAAAPLSGLI